MFAQAKIGSNSTTTSKEGGMLVLIRRTADFVIMQPLQYSKLLEFSSNCDNIDSLAGEIMESLSFESSVFVDIELST